MRFPLEELAQATRLTREGRLKEATELIRRSLSGTGAAPGGPADPVTVLDATPVAPALQATLPLQIDDATDVVFREVPEEPPATQKAPPPSLATFERHQFDSGGKSYAYWLYRPPLHGDTTPLPVVVMLHGCTQDGPDFAQGTAMNELAARQRCLVVYPEQRQDSNSMRCWNWFEPAHQRRGSGEPAMIAALALEVAATCGGDPSRIYVAGLSAGGAMAALVAQLYPDVFAAVGVHSGLPAQSARDLPSALAAMRKPGNAPAMGTAPDRQASPAIPTIVFHGNSDRTVHPANGKRIVHEALAASSAAGTELNPKPGSAKPSVRTVRHMVHHAGDGLPWVESWEIAGAPHAWAGGKAAGSYTDPQGPDASAAMLEFFLRHRRAG